MSRVKTVSNVKSKKFKTFEFDGLWHQAMGNPETFGIWMIYGAEKNGKTSFALKLAEYLSNFDRVHYISAEEGVSKSLQDTINRIGIKSNNRNLVFDEYVPVGELDTDLSKRKARKIVFIDNLTIYNDELKNGILRQLVQKHSDKLFVMVAHEERNEPYTATAKLVKKLAKVILHVKGLRCTVSGRVPGGVISIDNEKSALFWGEEPNNN